MSDPVEKDLEKHGDPHVARAVSDANLNPRTVPDQSKFEDVELPPRPHRPRPRFPNSSVRPPVPSPKSEPIAEPGISSNSPPKAHALTWSDFDSEVGSEPIDPNWASTPTQDDLATVDPRLLESSPVTADPRPSQDHDLSPRVPELEKMPPRPRSSKPGSSRPGSKSPSAGSGTMEPAKSARAIQQESSSGDDLRTRRIGEAVSLGGSRRLLMIQYYDGAGHWRELEPLRPDLHRLGRASFRPGTTDPEFLAVEHLRFYSEGDRLFVEEGDSINGVYLKLPSARPIELTTGNRFLVGQHLIEFQLGERSKVNQPLASPTGEVFRWKRLEPLAYLNFLGPDDRQTIRVPLTKLEPTVIGREGDVALTGDTWASRSHAKVFFQGGRFFLEDSGSTNGTFMKIKGRTLVKLGDLQSSVSGDVLLMGAVLIRVVET
jgi:FHA domain